jgi:hypothetical protein
MKNDEDVTRIGQPDVLPAPQHAAENQKALGWQSIETAPKNGTMILVVEPKNHQQRLVYYHEPWGKWLSVPGRIQVRPTHWISIPDPPVSRL